MPAGENLSGNDAAGTRTCSNRRPDTLRWVYFGREPDIRRDGAFFCHGTDHQTGYPTADRKNRYGTDLIFTQDRLRRANDSALHVYAMPAQRPYRNYRPALWDLQQNRFHCKQESVQGDGNVRHINQRPWATGHPGWCAFLCRPIGTGVRHFLKAW